MAAGPGRGYLIGGAAIAVLAGIAIWTLLPSRISPVGGIGGPFILTDADGRRFGFKELQSKPSLVYFGFTHCPDICPTTLFLLGEILKKLGPDASRINALFITVDPERDTPEQLQAYLAAFDPHLRGLTGSPAQLALARDIYGIEAAPVAGTGRNYNIDHTDTVFVLDETGRIRSSFDLHASSDEAIALVESVMQPR